MENIKWLFFDMGGVIIDDNHPENLRQQLLLDVAKKYNPAFTMSDVKKAWMDASGTKGSMRVVAMRELCKSMPNVEEVVKEYNDACQVDYIGLSKVRPEAKTVLEKLSSKYNLGIMANQNAKAMNHLIDNGLLDYFSHHKMSHHIGLEKPNPEFFKTVLDDTGARAEESIIIDDNWFRGCLPAKTIEMKTVLYERDIVPWPEDASPDWRIKNLNELLEIF